MNGTLPAQPQGSAETVSDSRCLALDNLMAFVSQSVSPYYRPSRSCLEWLRICLVATVLRSSEANTETQCDSFSGLIVDDSIDEVDELSHLLLAEAATT